MTKPARFGLGHHHHIGHICYLPLLFQQGTAAAAFERRFQFGSGIEVCAHTFHAGRDDKHDRLDAASGRFGHGVVDKRSAQNRQ